MSAALYAHQNPPRLGPIARMKRDGRKSEDRKRVEAMPVNERGERFPGRTRKSIVAIADRVGRATGREFIVRTHPITFVPIVWRAR